MAKKKNVASSSPPLQNLQIVERVNEPKKALTSATIEEKRIDRIREWTTFYRYNPSFFVEHYMGINLYPFQRYWINLMAHSKRFLGIASRASGKSWIIAVYTMARCILYPGTKVVITSSTKKQAGLIISAYCIPMIMNHPNINREILSYTANNNTYEVRFKNGSFITVVVSGESGRGNRSNINVLEERRLIPNDVIQGIIRPFMVSRKPPYMMNPKYSNIQELKDAEEPQEIIITSAHYKSTEWYPEAVKFLKDISEGDENKKAIFLDYLITLEHGIKTQLQMQEEKEQDDPITFLMEYGNIPFGSSSHAFYKLEMFNRVIKRSWRPITTEMFITTRKNPYDIPKHEDEIRLVSVDVAMRAGKTNDNTIITCARLFPGKNGWLTDIVYMESHNGENTLAQALRIKQIMEEFQGDTLILDIAGAGIGVADALSAVTKDEIRGVEYPAYTVMQSPYIDSKVYEELTSRAIARDAKKCIFPISATSQLNSTIAVEFRNRLKKKLVSFLVDEIEEEEFLIHSRNKDILDSANTEMRIYLLQAHVQTTRAINESIALEMQIQNGLVKLQEPEGARKDRYTSISYLNYYASLLDKELLREKSTSDENLDAVLGVTYII